MQILRSDLSPGKQFPNIAQMLEENARRFADKNVFCQKVGDHYEGITWAEFYRNIRNISCNLRNNGFKPGDKMLMCSPNRLELLELELAVMALGGISVPIWAFFNRDTAELLIKHSGATYITVEGEYQLHRILPQEHIKKIFVIDEFNHPEEPDLIPFATLLETTADTPALDLDAKTDAICLYLYTSGTMGVPKCVQLTHGNILSQQAALQKVWKLDTNDRFLSYLPWHHSFGGIFELFSALCSGATVYLESGYGKDPKMIMENWKLVKPTLFFSVPKVYRALIDLTKTNKEAQELFFHTGLKFIFTAAAALPKNISDEFEKRGIPVIEGWGLTETSPCCTLTDPAIKREAGVVGKPIPGVEIRIAEDGEIQVKGPNVMKGYFQNDEANKTAFTDDGWYCTGDTGEITPSGLKLVSRKDRIFKLSNGEKVVPSEMEMIIQNKCHYIAYALVAGGGKEYPVALLFPDKKALNRPEYFSSPEEGCFCPRNLNELSRCLQGCLHDANCGLNQKFSKVKYAVIIDDELSIEKNTLTTSMKIAPNKVMDVYKAHLENLYGTGNDVDQAVYVIKLETENNVSRKEIL